MPSLAIIPASLVRTSKSALLAAVVLSVTLAAQVADAGDDASKVYWQAHRGGGAHEAPDNTIGAAMYTWGLGGIPEFDIRTTKDGVVICLHDATMARTTNAPASISGTKINKLAFDEIRRWDAGVRFSEDFKGEIVPTLEEVFQKMQEDKQRLVYLDLKDVDLAKLGKLIDQYSVNEQILIASPRQSDCKTLKQITEGLRTMIWIGGTAQEIKDKFEIVVASNFDGVDQVQLHLHDQEQAGDFRYQIEREYLADALAKTQAAEIDLEVFPFQFDNESIAELMAIGIRWYATDEPKRFTAAVNKASAKR
ncbi:glycerophosphodiester phosphodiesterase [Rhodopirellula sp. MGV]|uniref:glycerophosphodiester phosphodiesterase n=1 Tax=Rhodopirellula sp. MGV TaxID=2023130 RepID=UPI000B965C9A|nr:glycerophosphodiester phosphodiesterase family protein [Rhodopirellula sp. MGV]OYP38167.1 glycerophosphodiester phosphodiesterase [Rhodopirellula sp. MGV]PNY38501.1 glycerophosphodiester phosphodiesterase [Rhodopirellula baltica]